MALIDLFLIFFICSLAYGIYDIITHKVEDSWKVRLRITNDDFNKFDRLMDICIVISSLIGIVRLGFL